MNWNLSKFGGALSQIFNNIGIFDYSIKMQNTPQWMENLLRAIYPAMAEPK